MLRRPIKVHTVSVGMRMFNNILYLFGTSSSPPGFKQQSSFHFHFFYLLSYVRVVCGFMYVYVKYVCVCVCVFVWY